MLLKDSEKLFVDNLILSTVPFAVIITTPEGLVLEVNPAVRDIFGLLEGEIEGTNIETILPNIFDNTKNCNDLFVSRGELELFEESVPLDVESSNSRLEVLGGVIGDQKQKVIVKYGRGNKEKWLEVKLNQFTHDDSFLFLMVINDVTDTTRQKIELDKINESLEKRVIKRTVELTFANRELQSALSELSKAQDHLALERRIASLSTFVRNAAHILNTPLGILITSQTTLDSKLDEVELSLKLKSLTSAKLTSFLSDAKQSACLSIRQVKFMANLVSRLKAFALEECAGDSAAVLLDKYLLETCSRFQSKFNISIILDYDSHLKLEISKRGYFDIILNELFDNAIRYNDKRCLRVTIKVTVVKNVLIILFHDNGPGLDPDVKGREFEPFVGSNNNRDRSFGLGLTLIYNIINLHLGGNIAIEATSNKGTLVKMQIPLAMVVGNYLEPL